MIARRTPACASKIIIALTNWRAVIRFSTHFIHSAKVSQPIVLIHGSVDAVVRIEALHVGIHPLRILHRLKTIVARIPVGVRILGLSIHVRRIEAFQYRLLRQVGIWRIARALNVAHIGIGGHHRTIIIERRLQRTLLLGNVVDCREILRGQQLRNHLEFVVNWQWLCCQRLLPRRRVRVVVGWQITADIEHLLVGRHRIKIGCLLFLGVGHGGYGGRSKESGARGRGLDIQITRRELGVRERLHAR
mmetsp:Transcript_49827/g.79430  ORF Transcript_49827/g.79430 Transcript_49827/m.79430 type:complete len:247 (+) Transcript_49827:405-1145(+)